MRLLEIGVASGDSIVAWRQYFHRYEHIYGIGYRNHQTERKHTDAEARTTLYMGDQSDRSFLDFVAADSGGAFDVVVDDGSHVPSHQRISFDALFPLVKDGGWYIVEDIETSYWDKAQNVYGYPLRDETSFVDTFKRVADVVNGRAAPRHASEQDIAAVMFSKNTVLVRKKTAEDRLAERAQARSEDVRRLEYAGDEASFYTLQYAYT